MVPKVMLLSRPECHLCDAAREVLRRIQRDVEFELAEVDVDSDPELARRYGADIPVVLVDNREAARHRVEPGSILSALRGEFGL